VYLDFNSQLLECMIGAVNWLLHVEAVRKDQILYFPLPLTTYYVRYLVEGCIVYEGSHSGLDLHVP